MRRLSLLAAPVAVSCLLGLLLSIVNGTSVRPEPVGTPPCHPGTGSLAVRATLWSPTLAGGGSDNYLRVELDAPALVPASEGERGPADIAVVVDVSGSMEGSKLRAAQRAAHMLLDQLSVQDRMVLLSYSDDTRSTGWVQTGEAGKASLSSAIDRLSTRGGTNFDDALTVARALFSEKKAERPATRRMILLSDGEPNEGRVEVDYLAGEVQEIRDRGVTVSTVGVGEGFNASLMASLAEAGAGFFGDVTQEEHLAEQLQRELHRAFSLKARNVQVSFDPSSSPAGGVGKAHFLGRSQTARGSETFALMQDMASGMHSFAIARFAVALSSSDTPVQIGVVRVRYLDLATKLPVCTELSLTSGITSDLEAARAQVPAEMLAAVMGAEAGERTAVATEQFQRGDDRAALQSLNGALEDLRHLFGHGADALAGDLRVQAGNGGAAAALQLRHRDLASFGEGVDRY